MSVDRQFPGNKTTLESIRELCMMSRKDRAAKYQSDMRDVFEDQVFQARSAIVAKYRSSPNVYSEIDTPLHRWYVASDWADDGTFIGPVKPAMNAADAKAREEEKARKLALGRATLAEVEAKLGVKPYQIPPDEIQSPVTKLVTKPQEPSFVTDSFVTEPAARYETPGQCAACGKPLEIGKPGRPSKFCSTACRMRGHREG